MLPAILFRFVDEMSVVAIDSSRRTKCRASLAMSTPRSRQYDAADLHAA